MNLLKTKFIKPGDNTFYTITWCIYSIVTLIGVLNHEIFRDEAQFWLIARDLSFCDIFSHLNIQGHPCLWYLLIFPFAKTGLPFVTIQVVHWLIAIGSAALFLFKAPFNKLTKILFVFSYYMIFEYAVIARNYSLTILFLFLIATIYTNRFIYSKCYALLLFALFNSHGLAFGAASALVLTYFIEAYKRKDLYRVTFALIIMISGAIITIIQLYPSAYLSNQVDITVPKTYLFLLNTNTIWTISTAIQNAFIPTSFSYEDIKLLLFFICMFCLFFILFLRKPFVFIFLTISSCWFFYVLTVKLFSSWRYHGLLLIFIIFSLWIKKSYTNNNNLISKFISKIINYDILENSLITFLTICLFINTIIGINSIRKEYLYSYSGSKEAATFINNYLPKQEIACHKVWATSLSPFIPGNKLWYIDRKVYGSYFIADSATTIYSNEISERDVIKQVKEKYKYEALLLLSEPLLIKPDSSFDIKLLFRNQKKIWKNDNEEYFLYKILFH